MAEPFLGEIRIFTGNFAPINWAFCDGSLVAISTNVALFSILGTTYGGNGVSTFALPDLRGRVPIHRGQGPGLSPYSLGDNAGQETVTLTLSNMPSHTHVATFTPATGGSAATTVAASSGLADEVSPIGNIPAVPNFGHTQYPSYTAPANSTGNLGGVASSSSGSGGGTIAISPSGGSQPFALQQPYLVLNFIIALQGIFPSRS